MQLNGLSLSSEEVDRALRKEAYVNVPFPMDRLILEQAMQAFFAFLNEPEEIKTHIIFMFSSNVQKLLKTEEYSPGWHDVIQLDKKQIGKPFARWAIVAFGDAHGVEALSRTQTHKWYTENS